MAAIGGDIRITRIEAVAPEVLLEKAADGRVNWELVPSEGVGASRRKRPEKATEEVNA